MNISSKVAAGAVAASTPVTALQADTAQALLSLALGLSGVALARQVFLNRERRQTGRRQPLGETLPLTMCAMLVAGVVIWDRKLGLSLSVFTGLGVGWTAILLLDVVGAAILRWLKRALGVTDADLGLPPDHAELVRKIDEEDKP